MNDDETLEDICNCLAIGGQKNQKVISKLGLLKGMIFALCSFNRECIARAICDHIKILDQMRKIQEAILDGESLITDYKEYIINKEDLKRLKKLEKKIAEFSEGLDKDRLSKHYIDDVIGFLSEDENMTLEQAVAKYNAENK